MIEEAEHLRKIIRNLSDIIVESKIALKQNCWCKDTDVVCDCCIAVARINQALGNEIRE